MIPSRSIDFEDKWANALSFDRFSEEADQNVGLWNGVYRTAAIPEWASEKISEYSRGLRILILAEDWCGDAANTVPVLAKLGAEIEGVEARIIRRDENLDVMDEYLTNGARSIPIAILLDEDYNEIGHWGPRPRELQQWVMENKDIIPKEERYPQVRRWYAQDRGESTLRELLDLL